MLYICLIEPEIPQNTGNIARTAAATGSTLVLVHPLGFDISEKAVRRSGLDYWKDVKKIEYRNKEELRDNYNEDSYTYKEILQDQYRNKEEFFSSVSDKECWFFSSHGEKRYTDISFPMGKDIYLIFGKESVGLGDEILTKNKERALRIPLKKGERCLNLSNSVAIAVYECLRQWNYPDFE